MNEKENYYLGVDVGGTFTDIVLESASTGEISFFKIPSRTETILNQTSRIIIKLCEIAQIEPNQIIYCNFGNTTVTNSIIERKYSRTGLITTKGFRDVLEIGRGPATPNPYDPYCQRPIPLIPRYLRLEVEERISPDGKIVRKLSMEDVKRAIHKFKTEGVTSIAVSLLHSYANSEHEEAIKDYIEQEYREAYVTTSSELHRLIKEYERTSSTVANAAVRPIVVPLMRSLENSVENLCGIGIHAMRSDGGAMSLEAAKIFCIHMVESGPAAGALLGSYLGRILNYNRIIAFDMGGTTAKATLIENGSLRIAHSYEVGGDIHGGHLVEGSGYPVLVPVIDLVEVGAGGGSIAYVNDINELRVGPESAGSNPGPVCYGWGGTEPTVCDANLILGRVNPDNFLGGEMKLDVAKAKYAIKNRIADKLGLSVEKTASAIIKLANFSMIHAVRTISIDRGKDPRDYSLVCFGGGGAQHAAAIALELDMKAVIIPKFPEVASAIGLLLPDIRYSYVRTVKMRIDKLSKSRIIALVQMFQEFEKKARSKLKRDGIKEDQIRIQKVYDLCYYGQATWISICVEICGTVEEEIRHATELFYMKYKEEYGYLLGGDMPLEIVNISLIGIGLLEERPVKTKPIAGENPQRAVKGTMPVYFDEYDDYICCPIYERDRLEPGNLLKGPCIIEQYGTTGLIPPNKEAKVHTTENIIINLQ